MIHNRHYQSKIQVKKLKKAREEREPEAAIMTPCLNCGKPCQDTFCGNSCYMGDDTRLETVILNATPKE